MTLSRSRRVATGVAAGVIVLCAALLGASFRSDSTDVAVSADIRPDNIIPIEDDPVVTDVEAAEVPDSGDSDDRGNIDTATSETPNAAATEPDATEAAADDATEAATDEATDPVQVIEPDDLPANTDSSDTDTDSTDGADSSDTDADGAATDEPTEDGAASTDSGDGDGDDDTSAATTEPQAPLTAADDALGTGGGVDDAECALDRLVIYAGARVSGVAGSIRAALNQAGFAAGCAAPVTVLASNCPLQFAGVLGADSGYDPATSFVASSDSVDRATMTAVMGAVGYAGNEINILDFGFVNPDKPGEQWMAIFIPPSFAGWEDLASRAGLSPSTNSLCAPSGELVG